jgi:pilus assembly protein Flp/PilA
MTRLVQRCLASRAGATSIEYTLIAALISVVIVTAVTTVGTTLNSAFFTAIAGTLSAAAP